MKRFFQVFGIAAIALAVAAGAAVAQGQPPAGDTCCGMHHRMGMGPGMGPGMGMGPRMGMGMGLGPGPHIDRLAAALGLSDEQKASLDSLHTDLMNTVQPIFEQKRTAMEQLHQAIDGGSTDACALGQLVLQAHGNDAALKAAHDRFEAGLVALLTPEQKTKYDAIKAMHPAFRRGPPMGDPGDEE
jgi:Spy/CpxP family protein refolding chaperone